MPSLSQGSIILHDDISVHCIFSTTTKLKKSVWASLTVTRTQKSGGWMGLSLPLIPSGLWKQPVNICYYVLLSFKWASEWGGNNEVDSPIQSQSTPFPTSWDRTQQRKRSNKNGRKNLSGQEIILFILQVWLAFCLLNFLLLLLWRPWTQSISIGPPGSCTPGTITMKTTDNCNYSITNHQQEPLPAAISSVCAHILCPVITGLVGMYYGL